MSFNLKPRAALPGDGFQNMGPVSVASLDQVCFIWGGTVQHAHLLGNKLVIQSVSSVNTHGFFSLKFLLAASLSCVWLLALQHPSERAASGCAVHFLLIWMNLCFLVLWCWLCWEPSYRKCIPRKNCETNGCVPLNSILVSPQTDLCVLKHKSHPVLWSGLL